jgi:hypothetical protein
MDVRVGYKTQCLLERGVQFILRSSVYRSCLVIQYRERSSQDSKALSNRGDARNLIRKSRSKTDARIPKKNTGVRKVSTKFRDVRKAAGPVSERRV